MSPNQVVTLALHSQCCLVTIIDDVCLCCVVRRYSVTSRCRDSSAVLDALQADLSQLAAKYVDGVLHVTAPKRAVAQPHTILVE